jgi:hypothetical protein
MIPFRHVFLSLHCGEVIGAAIHQGIVLFPVQGRRAYLRTISSSCNQRLGIIFWP